MGPNGTSQWSKTYNKDDKHREQSRSYGVFANIWADSPVYLDSRLESVLRVTAEDDILRAPRRWCVRWWKTCGKKVPQRTGIAQLRSQILEWRRELQQPAAKITISRGNQPSTTPSQSSSYLLTHHTTHIHTYRHWPTTLAADKRRGGLCGCQDSQNYLPAWNRRLFE